MGASDGEVQGVREGEEELQVQVSLLEELRAFHRRTGASHFASSASVLPVLVEVRDKMREGDVCLLGKAHGVTAYNLVFGIPMTEAPVQGEFGSLGSALPFALGVAKMRPHNTVYVVVGDGEMQEGSVWESLLAMDRLGIWNVEVHVDGNGMQGMGMCRDFRMPWNAVKWHRTKKGDGWECHYGNA